MRRTEPAVLQKLAHIDVGRLLDHAVPRASRHLAPSDRSSSRRRKAAKAAAPQQSEGGRCVSPRFRLRCFGGQDGSASQAGQTQRGVAENRRTSGPVALSAINRALWGL